MCVSLMQNKLLFNPNQMIIEYYFDPRATPLACPCRGGPRSASGRITRKYHSTKTDTREPEPRIDGEPGFDR